ncbi:cysteine-rich venom protein ophanin-like [Oncorhynchus keta]|uniref:cysteine-rich venom protein ophanin-like n=1 Tax=Oncorhynchus keta TaxID=8018 RepID=UPI00227C5395|nr:cysteine-rich venom protein ophanin-like [Oncorhynchus keta]
MFALLVCILTLHDVYSACNVVKMCPDSTVVQAEILNQHNAFRRAVTPTARDMLKMKWSEEAAASAQAWVDTCSMTHGPPSSRMLGDYEMGENLFMSSTSRNWTQTVTAWHSEVRDYSYPNGSINGKPIGHYTQVVWNSSYKVGCGVTLCPGPVYFYGCQYYRAGNYKVAPYKEGATCADCPDSCENKLCTNPCPYVNKYANCAAMKKQAGCSNSLVYAWCPALCQCTSKIT